MTLREAACFLTGIAVGCLGGSVALLYLDQFYDDDEDQGDGLADDERAADASD